MCCLKKLSMQLIRMAPWGESLRESLALKFP